MKTAQLPPVRVEPSVRDEIEAVLREGETLSQFVETAALQAARQRKAQQEFLVDLAVQHGDFDLPLRAMDAIQQEMRIPRTNPYTCRKVGSNPLERELVIPFGGSGCVALFEILSGHEVAISAIRHQREDDYH